MKKKQIILIIVFVALVLSSGFLLYRSYNSKPLRLIEASVSGRDVEIRNQVEAIKIKIHKAIKNVDAGGSLDELLESSQFQEFSSEIPRPIILGSYGRANPFVPPE